MHLWLAFLEHLQADRRNGPSTRNARLAAIKSFMHFLEYRVPSALEQLRRVLAKLVIPFQKTDTRLVRHLTQAEMQAILDVPDPSTRDGVRDRAMLHLAFTGGLRVSELVGLKLNDVTFRAGYVDLRVTGKGRKQRVLTLWKTVAGSLRAWLSIRGDVSVPELFLNARAQPLPALASSTSLISTFPLPLTNVLP
jgi:integrase/recombinase XerD